jgi:GTP-binding protein HflX
MFDVREKPKMVERAFLIGVQTPEETPDEIESLLDELEELVETLEIGIIDRVNVKLRTPHPAHLLGKGKTQELIDQAKEAGCDCIVFDVELTPAQQRNWEKLSGLCVIDRQEIILDIFNTRAQTREAVLQVALARAEHSLPRLRNAWTHLSRQRGGGGVTQRGEGESQIELDGRMVREEIAKLKRELATVVKQRATQRKRRERVPLPTAAIVGYTNAGKSTLLNKLTGATVLSEDKLFATLDPTTRQLQLPGGPKLLVTDTVGFVRRLPHRLVEAFKATLEEAVSSHLLIHVVDLSSTEFREHYETTKEVLKELGAEDKRILTVYNKIDAVAPGSVDLTDLPASDGVFVSAQTGEGLDELQERLVVALAETQQFMELLIPHDRYDLVNELHRAGAVRHQEARAEGVHLVGNIPERLVGQVREFSIKG